MMPAAEIHRMRPRVNTTYGDRDESAYKESISLQEKAVQQLPEGTSRNSRGETAHAPYPMVYLDESKGATVTDVDGNE